jgi:hypothetical protein
LQEKAVPLSPAAERVRQVRTKKLIVLLHDTAEHIPEPERLEFRRLF